jgi:hypothetical protein
LHFGRQLLDFAKKHNFWDFAKKIKFWPAYCFFAVSKGGLSPKTANFGLCEKNQFLTCLLFFRSKQKRT